MEIFIRLFRLGLLLAYVSAITPLAAAPISREERIQRYVQFCSEVRENVIEGGTCPHYPLQVAARLATDPAGLAAWVRKHIAYEPTLGSNRGPEGALAAMSAGDWDRALLLGDMFRAGGHSPRYIAMARTPGEIEALLAAWLKSESCWKTLAPDAPPADSTASRPVSALLADNSIAPDSPRLHHERVARLWKELLDETSGPVEEVAKQVETAAASFIPISAAGNQAQAARFRKAMQTRIMVEIDIDDKPVVFPAGPETSLPASTVLEALPRIEGVPEDQVTRLSLAIELEGIDTKGATTATTLFAWEKDLASLWAQPIRLEIVPVNVAYVDPAFTWKPAQWVDRLSKLEQFQVVLRHGDDAVGGPTFTPAGTVLAGSSGGQHEETANVGQGLGNMFGGGFGAGNGDDESGAGAPPIPAPQSPSSSPAGSSGSSAVSTTPAAASAPSPRQGAPARPLSLTIEVHEPGQPVTRQKRLLVGDLRPGLSPVYTTDLLACGGLLGPLSVSWLALDAITANAPAIGEVLSSPDPKRFEGHDDLKRFSSLLHDWQLGRLALAARHLRAHPDLHLQSGPTVVMLSNQLYPDAKAEAVNMRVAIDVVFDGLTLVSRSDQGFPGAFAANLRLGIGSTLLETALLRRRLPPPGPTGILEPWRKAALGNKSPIATQVSENGIQGKARPHPLAAWAIGGGEAGKLLVFPGDEAPRFWWSIDPGDGRTIGRGESGEGMSMMEYLQIIKMNLSNLKCNLAFMNAFLGGAGDDAAMDWMKCMTGTDNPGSYVNWAGSAMEVYQVVEWGGILAQVGDALAGAYDLYELIKGK